jgi:hypothetical protein
MFIKRRPSNAQAQVRRPAPERKENHKTFFVQPKRALKKVKTPSSFFFELKMFVQ